MWWVCPGKKAPKIKKKIILLKYRHAVCFWALCWFYGLHDGNQLCFMSVLVSWQGKILTGWPKRQQASSIFILLLSSAFCRIRVFLMHLVFKETVFNTASLLCYKHNLHNMQGSFALHVKNVTHFGWSDFIVECLFKILANQPATLITSAHGQQWHLSKL